MSIEKTEMQRYEEGGWIIDVYTAERWLRETFPITCFLAMFGLVNLVAFSYMSGNEFFLASTFVIGVAVAWSLRRFFLFSAHEKERAAEVRRKYSK